jgi:hypothetical protein
MLQEVQVVQTLGIRSPSELLPPKVVADLVLGGEAVVEVHSEEAGTASLAAVPAPPHDLLPAISALSAPSAPAGPTELLPVPTALPSPIASADLEELLQDFIRGISVLAPQPILRTPAKKIKGAKETQASSVRRSGRLMSKALTKGGKTLEELAQELLCKKMEGVAGQQSKADCARERLVKFFDAPLPQEAMAAIEDLLQVINLEGKGGTTSTKAGKKASAARSTLEVECLALCIPCILCISLCSVLASGLSLIRLVWSLQEL